MSDEKKHTTLRMRPDLLGQVDAEAAKRGWSRTILIEQVLAAWLVEQGHEVGIRVAL